MSKIIRSTDENALEELKEKLAQMESAHKEMVARNKHYFKNGTMKGYGDFTDERAAKLDLAIQGTYEKKPYASYQLQTSNQEIRRIKMRIKALEHEQNREAETYDTENWVLKWWKTRNYNVCRLSFPIERREKCIVNCVVWGLCFRIRTARTKDN